MRGGGDRWAWVPGGGTGGRGGLSWMGFGARCVIMVYGC